MSELKYKRVLLKLSGEVLAGKQKTGVDVETVGKICDKIKEIVEMGVQVAIVVGGGNFWRGRNGHQMERTTADYMGMLATAMNGLALQDALEARGIYSRVQTAIEMREIAEPFIQRKAEKHLGKGRVVIFACGTGHPYFTTDTAAVLRATEIKVMDSTATAMCRDNHMPLLVFGIEDPENIVRAVKGEKIGTIVK